MGKEDGGGEVLVRGKKKGSLGKFYRGKGRTENPFSFFKRGASKGELRG